MAIASIRIEFDPDDMAKAEREAEDWLALSTAGKVTSVELDAMIGDIVGDVRLRVNGKPGKRLGDV